MTLPGETISSGHVPDEADQVSCFKVLRSGAGYYIGTTYFDQDIGAELPYSRESVEYWATCDEARQALIEGKWTPRT